MGLHDQDDDSVLRESCLFSNATLSVTRVFSRPASAEGFIHSVPGPVFGHLFQTSIAGALGPKAPLVWEGVVPIIKLISGARDASRLARRPIYNITGVPVWHTGVKGLN